MKNCRSAPNATAVINGRGDMCRLSGRVDFFQKNGFVLIVADIKGLPQTETGFFGFHIHEGDSCSGEGFVDTKGHYNPLSNPHPRHAGDMPPLMRSNGGAYMAFADDRFAVEDIIGRTVVIHDRPDDFTSQPSGNAGTKIGCGVIRLNKAR